MIVEIGNSKTSCAAVTAAADEKTVNEEDGNTFCPEMRLGSGCYKNINSTHTYGNLPKDWGQGQAGTG